MARSEELAYGLYSGDERRSQRRRGPAKTRIGSLAAPGVASDAPGGEAAPADSPFGEKRSFSALRRRARASLEANLIAHRQGPFLRAGGHQFRTLWTRDFCFAARGLLALGQFDAVRAQLEALLRRRRGDGLVARGLDSLPPPLRVVLAGAGVYPPLSRLHPEFHGEHGTLAIDSNALVVLLALDWAEATGERRWLERWRPALRQLLGFYERFRRGGLIQQPAFSDWQDSVRRVGASFYTNLLVHRARQRLGTAGEAVEAERALLERRFRDPESGLFRSLEGRPEISVDGPLLALALGWIAPDSAAGRALFASLCAHPVWGQRGLPRASWPDWPAAEISWTTRLVGLRHYHDELVWSWLCALAATVACKVGERDEAERILDHLDALVERDGAVVELYGAHAPWPAFETRFYRAERPFSWGAGMLVEALELWGAG